MLNKTKRYTPLFENMLNPNTEPQNTKSESDNFLMISTHIGGGDFRMFKDVINQGIDSHLEGFVKSTFLKDGDRYELNFHNSELPILIRRLRDMGTDEAESWADDIENHEPDVEEINQGSMKTGKTRGSTWDRAGKVDTGYEESLGSKLKRERYDKRREENIGNKATVAKVGLSNLAKTKANFRDSLSIIDADNPDIPTEIDDKILAKVNFRIMGDFYKRRLPKLLNQDPDPAPTVVACSGPYYSIMNDEEEKPLNFVFEKDLHQKGNRFCFIIDRMSATVITIKLVPGEWTEGQVAEYLNQDPAVKDNLDKKVYDSTVFFDNRKNVISFT